MTRREVFSNDAAELQLAQESYGPGREVAHGPWITGIYRELWTRDRGGLRLCTMDNSYI